MAEVVVSKEEAAEQQAKTDAIEKTRQLESEAQETRARESLLAESQNQLRLDEDKVRENVRIAETEPLIVLNSADEGEDGNLTLRSVKKRKMANRKYRSL